MLPLILSIDKYGNIKWYVDAEFVVNKEMSRHTGVFMTVGTGGAYAQSTKQKLNTKSSTRAKLSRVGNVLIQVICTRYFLKDN